MLKETIIQESLEIFEEMQANRRWLHAHPEMGFDLTETKLFVRTALEEMGYHVSECGKAGLSACIGKPGKKVFLLRADMDALPIKEDTDLSFSSPNGKMHACGHDLHTAILLGAAKLLKRHENDLDGMVKFMFQPAEEVFEGSLDMIRAGILENPRPDAALMFHVTTGLPLPAGTVIISGPGVSAPAADYFSIKVQGKGCHGSTPQNGVDPLTTAAHILIALQEIQARELSASEEAVITIGSFHGGEVGNVIPDSALLQGTIRTYDEQIRTYLKQRISQISQGIASAFRAQADVSFGSGCPTLVNDPGLCETVTSCLQDLLGAHGALRADILSGGKPSRGGGSEDFAYISQEVPALMLALAAGEPAKGYSYPLHHPKVTFDESAMKSAVAAFVYTAIQYLLDTEVNV